VCEGCRVYVRGESGKSEELSDCKPEFNVEGYHAIIE